MRIQAIWNDTVLAESDETIVVEGNHYFPPISLHKGHFETSGNHTVCGWKGEASYYDVVANGKANTDAAQYYPETKETADNILGYVAFWLSWDFNLSYAHLPEVPRDYRFLRVVARLKSDFAIDQAQTDLDWVTSSLAGEYPTINGGWRARLVPLD